MGGQSIFSTNVESPQVAKETPHVCALLQSSVIGANASRCGPAEQKVPLSPQRGFRRSKKLFVEVAGHDAACG